MIWRAPLTERSRKEWWDTALCRRLAANGLAGVIWVEHFGGRVTTIPANDRDHIRW